METHEIITIAIAGAAFVMSVIGPCLTAHITCKHESEMYDKRFKKEHQHDVIEQYLKSIGKYVFSPDLNNVENFGEAVSEIFMYTPLEIREDIKTLNQGVLHVASIQDYEQRQMQKLALQPTYLALCEKLSSLSRTSKSKKKRSKKQH